MTRKDRTQSRYFLQPRRSNRLALEQLEERASPTNLLDVLGWSLLGPAFLRLAPASPTADIRAVDPASVSTGPAKQLGDTASAQASAPLSDLSRSAAPSYQPGSGESITPRTAEWNFGGSASQEPFGSLPGIDVPLWMGSQSSAHGGGSASANAAATASHGQSVGSSATASGAAPSTGSGQVSGSNSPAYSPSPSTYGAGGGGGSAAASQPPSTASSSSAITDAQKQDVMQQFMQRPTTFEVNQGQFDSVVKFVARGAGDTLYLGSNSAVLLVTQPHGGNAGQPSTGPVKVSTVLLQPVGANPNVTPIGLDPSGKTSTYFIGNDSSKWHQGVPNYNRVEYPNLYPGIDMVYHGASQTQMEYDFIVAPGANPASIQLSYQGADGMSLDAKGNLILHTSVGDVVQGAPVIYQNVNGAKQFVSGQMTLQGNRVGFTIGAYDASKPLVIDPTFSITYGSYLGGTGFDIGLGIALDGSTTNGGPFAFITGSTTSSDFPIRNAFTFNGVAQSTLHHNGTTATEDAFVTRMATNLSSRTAGTWTSQEWSTFLGGSGGDGTFHATNGDQGEHANGIAYWTDNITHPGAPVNYLYIVGQTDSTDFPTAPTTSASTTIQRNLFTNQTSNAFVTRLQLNGGSAPTLDYSTYFGRDRNAVGLEEEYGTGISVITDGPIYGDAFISGWEGAAPFGTTGGDPHHDFNAFVGRIPVRTHELINNGPGTNISSSSLTQVSDDNGYWGLGGSTTPLGTRALGVANVYTTDPGTGYQWYHVMVVGSTYDSDMPLGGNASDWNTTATNQVQMGFATDFEYILANPPATSVTSWTLIGTGFFGETAGNGTSSYPIYENDVATGVAFSMADSVKNSSGTITDAMFWVVGYTSSSNLGNPTTMAFTGINNATSYQGGTDPFRNNAPFYDGFAVQVSGSAAGAFPPGVPGTGFVGGGGGTLLGSSQNNIQLNGVAVDGAGNAFVVGTTNTDSFTPDSDPYLHLPTTMLYSTGGVVLGEIPDRWLDSIFYDSNNNPYFQIFNNFTEYGDSTANHDNVLGNAVAVWIDPSNPTAAATAVTITGQTLTATTQLDTTTNAFQRTGSGDHAYVAAFKPPPHLRVTAPASVTHGTAFSITVTAQDSNNNTQTTYVGTVHFTTSTFTNNTLPSDYTFTTSDNGVHTFTGVVLGNVGTQSIKATDTSTTSMTGAVGVIRVT